MGNQNQPFSNSRSSFAIRLKEAFSQSSNTFIAETLGIGKAAVTAYMRGRIPPYHKLIEVSRATNCNLHWLLTGEGQKFLPKSDSSGSQKPKVIVVQSDKPGSGTSTAVLLIGRILAQREYRVLILDKSSYPLTSQVVIHTISSAKSNTSDDSLDLSETERFILYSQIKNLHLAVSLNNKKYLKINNGSHHHAMSFNEARQYYDFVLIDSDAGTDPFSCKDWFINDFLNNCNLLIPYDFMGWDINRMSRILSYFNETKAHYKRVNLLGVFVSKYRKPVKKDANQFASIIELVGKDKIFQNKIRLYSNYLTEKQFNKFSFPREKHSVVADYNALTSEILDRLSQVPDSISNLDKLSY